MVRPVLVTVCIVVRMAIGVVMVIIFGMTVYIVLILMALLRWVEWLVELLKIWIILIVPRWVLLLVVVIRGKRAACFILDI